jgi:hypothetical protein
MIRKGAVCTIIAKNYLPHARCLLDSVAQFHPDLSLFAVLADQVDGYFDSDVEPFTVIKSEDLSIPHSKWFHFKYSLLELCTALKPYAIEHLFSEYDFDFVIYLDPDVLLCAALDSVIEGLECYSMLVTPHVTEPLDPGLGLSELDILRAGTYNLGFLGIARTEEALAFLQWWKQRLYEYCVIDLPRGLFLDQRWIDFVPSFISRLCIVREPGYNVAYWNLSHREISASRGTFLANGHQLFFFHFSGFDPDAPDCLSQHQDGYHLPESGPLKELAEHYRQLLFDYGYSECRNWPYAYGYFSNGVRIPDLGRSIVQEDPSITDRITDPFSEEAFQEFVRVWNRPLPASSGQRPTITRLAYKVYRTRPDLQAAMPDVFNGDYHAFVKWLLSTDVGEHALPDVFLSPFKSVGPGDVSVAKSAKGEVLAGGDSWSLAAQSPRDNGNDSGLAQLIWLGRAGLCVPRLALEIYSKRPDLQAFFPDPTGRDAVKYMVWLLSYGKREYRISKVFLSTLRRQWTAIIESLPNFWERLRYRMFLTLATLSAALGPLMGRAVRAHLMLHSFKAVLKPRTKVSVTNAGSAPPFDSRPSFPRPIVGIVIKEGRSASRRRDRP